MNGLPNPIIVPMTVMSNTMGLALSVESNSQGIDLDIVSDSLNVPIGCEYDIVAGDAERYTGEYEFVPTNEAQIININHKLATANIVIDPIPSNYGLITWNGSTLTVS